MRARSSKVARFPRLGLPVKVEPLESLLANMRKFSTILKRKADAVSCAGRNSDEGMGLLVFHDGPRRRSGRATSNCSNILKAFGIEMSKEARPMGICRGGECALDPALSATPLSSNHSVGGVDRSPAHVNSFPKRVDGRV